MGAALLKALAAALLALAAAQTLAAQETAPVPPETGPTVRAIEIRSEVELPEKERGELGSLLAVEVGGPLTDERARRTLRNVQASGAAAEVELYTRPAPGEEGVVVAIVLRPQVRVERVRLEGELGLAEGELRRTVPQRAGDPLIEDRVVRGVYELQDLYRERGYLHSEVRVRAAIDEATRRAEVIYQIASGPRARVGTVAFEGETAPFTPAQLIQRLAAKPGEPYGRGRVRDDAERLQGWLVEQGYRTARVDPPAERPDAAAGTVHLTYPLVVGPQVVLQVAGADAKRLRKQGLLPFMEEHGYDEALLLQAVERIEEHYQRQGHYQVRVDSSEEARDGVLAVALTIVPGPVFTLQEVDFTGNQSFDDERLQELMTVSERRLLSLGSGRLVEEELEADLDNVRRFYALQGFAEARVGPPVVRQRGRDLLLEVPVEEGVRRRVGALDFSNVQSLDPDGLRRRLPLREQGPFHPLLLDQALAALRAAYADAGYAEAQVSARANWNPDETVVDLVFEVIEGPQTLVDRVIVRGNRATESEVIRRTLGVERGAPISETRLLELERDLYQLGIFSSVEVELTRAGLGGAQRDLLVRVEEGRPRRVTYGLGYEYNGDDHEQSGPRGGVSFGHGNLWGKAVSLRADLRLSEFDQSTRLIVDQPYVGRLGVPLTSSLFYFHETKDHWEVDRYGTRFESVESFGDRRVGLALDYRIVETRLDPGFGLIDVDEREDRPYQLSSLVPSFLWDRRDDPVLASEGWSTLAQLQYAFPAFGTDGDFLKLFVQQTQYLRLGRAGVVAASARFGGIEPFAELPEDDPELPEELPSSDIFIDERFFAGGQTTHRAYERDDLGIRGETLIPRPREAGFAEVGGNGLFLFNLEYRFPIAGAFGGTLFYDAGNVWADWRSIDWGEVKEGIGVGVRYLSPIGPLRLDAGWKLDPDEGEDRGPVVLVSFGNPF
ncbi:MAG TPA: POTRA domain-containing protein [Thermoanaerobaculia bacterium]|nr:POTRA domain-containing protein [Thermoanaerobaculia bacterium]